MNRSCKEHLIIKVFVALCVCATLLPGQVVTIDNESMPTARVKINNNFSWLRDNRAALSHVHIVADVTGLQAALDGKAATAHTHTGVYAPLAHVHIVADITNLQTELDGKAAHPERKRDVLRERHVRPQRVGLEHHADLAFLRR